MTADDSLVLYAAGYDSNGTYIDDLYVEWKRVGDIENVAVFDSILIFGKGCLNAPAAGVIIARYQEIHDHTGTIAVNPGALHHAKLNTAKVYHTYPIIDTNIYVGDTVVVYRAGYDRCGNFRESLSINPDSLYLSGTLDGYSRELI
jgi:hypothetical protein